MAVDFDAFVEWAEDRFDSVIVQGKEVRLNSIFTEDHKHHLWASPSGGKYKRDDGVYHCWYTDRKGTLVKLVMLVDDCSYYEAKRMLSGKGSIRELELELKEYLKNLRKEKTQTIELKLPENTYPIYSLNYGDRIGVENYLAKRKLSGNGLMYCTNGQFKNRIIIPYYDKKGKLIYFNGRHIGKSKLRYRGPDKSIGIGKGDVLYCPSWPEIGSKVYLTEGEFDALTLSACGLNAIACGGKTLSDLQVSMLKDYDTCIAIDSDNAGICSLATIGNKLIANHIKVTYVFPPKGIKDWNKMLQLFRSSVVYKWIKSHEKVYDEWTGDFLNLA